MHGKLKLTDPAKYEQYQLSHEWHKHNEVSNLRGFFHVASHVKKLPDGTVISNEWHDHCERGAKSWCKFQQDISNKTKTYTSEPGLPEDIIKHVKPILADLSSDALLKKCLHGLTQNQNESFNGTIWNRIPKGTYVGLRQLGIGVYDMQLHIST